MALGLTHTEQLDDFETKCIFHYCRWNSDEINSKAMNNVFIDERALIAQTRVSAKYLGVLVDTMVTWVSGNPPSSIPERITNHQEQPQKFQKWLKRKRADGFIIEEKGKYYKMKFASPVGKLMFEENKTLQDIVNAVSRVIQKTTVLKTVTIYRAVVLTSIRDYNPARGAFQSWTTDLDYLKGEAAEEYGKIILKATLRKGDHAYYDGGPLSESQFVLDYTVKTSVPQLISTEGGFEIFKVTLIFGHTDSTIRW